MNKQLLDLILSSFPKDFSEVLKFVKPTIGIKAGEKTQEREATSKFGGSPDIPNGFNCYPKREFYTFLLIQP